MHNVDIVCRRLHSQRLVATTFEKPSEVVAWFGAVQAQDYLGALWAVGMRMRQAVEVDVERALADKAILRSWPMRGTLHFVPSEDAHWMLELLTPRVIARTASVYRKAGLDDTVFARSGDVLVKALQGGKQLTRDAVYQVLEAAGIPTRNQRGLHITGWLAQKGIICFGARKGKQQTFALLDEWAPAAKTPGRDEALAVLAQRYFRSHGPATLQDFVWWSGLSVAEAKAGLSMVEDQFAHEVIDGQTYWLDPSMADVMDTLPSAHLLPAFDEYMVAYKDRGAILGPAHAERSPMEILNPAIEVDGRIVGLWKRALRKDAVAITAYPFTVLSDAEQHAFITAAERYGRFLGLPTDLSG